MAGLDDQLPGFFLGQEDSRGVRAQDPGRPFGNLRQGSLKIRRGKYFLGQRQEGLRRKRGRGSRGARWGLLRGPGGWGTLPLGIRLYIIKT